MENLRYKTASRKSYRNEKFTLRYKFMHLREICFQVITKPTPIEGKYFAINSFGFGGSNGHILLSPHDRIKKKLDESITTNNLPRLVTISGRTENGLNCFFSNVR